MKKNSVSPVSDVVVKRTVRRRRRNLSSAFRSSTVQTQEERAERVANLRLKHSLTSQICGDSKFVEAIFIDIKPTCAIDQSSAAIQHFVREIALKKADKWSVNSMASEVKGYAVVQPMQTYDKRMDLRFYERWVLLFSPNRCATRRNEWLHDLELPHFHQDANGDHFFLRCTCTATRVLLDSENLKQMLSAPLREICQKAKALGEFDKTGFVRLWSRR